MANEEEIAELAAQTAENSDAPPKEKGKGGRKRLHNNIPREQIHIPLSEDEKSGAIDTSYTKVKEELDITLAKVRVLEYMQEKAVLVEIDNNGEQKRRLKAAQCPRNPLGSSIASISLLAFIIISKYCDGLPLFR